MAHKPIRQMSPAGSVLKSANYNKIRIPADHRFASMRATGGMVQVHRLVMAEALNRPLLPAPLETVHHKNGDRYDNRLANLELRIGAHGAGQAVEDRVADALWVLRRYAPQFLVEMQEVT